MSQDNQLQKNVMAELNWEPSIVAAHIGVMASDGVITLTGHVTSFAEKYAAERAASRVKGVKAVAEEIEVKLPFDSEREDDEIAAAALERLAWDTFVPKDAIKVKVEKGWVTVSGSVEWAFQRESAAQDVRRLAGVTGFSNQIIIEPRVNAKNISDDIRHALHRSWFSPTAVKVTADGGHVHLEGKVPSFHDRDMAANTAWAAPGTTMVSNDITVN